MESTHSSNDSFHTATDSDSTWFTQQDYPQSAVPLDDDEEIHEGPRTSHRPDIHHDLRYDEEDTTPLHNAAYNGNVSKVRRLLEAGENVDAMRGDLWGDMRSKMTPLMVAALSGQPAVVELLLQHGADMSITCRHVFGMTAVGLAMVRASRNEERIRAHSQILDTLLVHWGDSLDKLDFQGFFRFRNGASLLCYAVFASNAECVRVLLKHGASLERRFLVSDTHLYRHSLGSDDSGSDSDSNIPPTDDVNSPEQNPPRAQTVLEFAEERALLYRHHSPVFDEVVEVLRQEAARRSTTEPGIASLLELSRLKLRLVAGRGGRSVEIKIDSWVESGVLPSYLKAYILYKRFEE